MKTKNLITWCNLIAFITAITGVSQFLGMLTKSYQLGKDDSDTLIYQFLVEGLEAWGIIACCILFFLLANNAKKGKVFVRENEKLLMTFGAITLCLGFIPAILIEIFSVNELAKSTAIMLMLIGFSFVFFSLIMQIGRKLKEEQELTI